MAQYVYNAHRFDIASGTVSYSTDTTFSAMLVSTAYFDVSEFVDQDTVLFAPNSSESPQAFEPSTATGYARQTVTIDTVTEVDALNEVHVTGSTAITFASVSSGAGVIGGLILFAELAASDSSGRRLVAAYEGQVTPNGGDLIYSPSTSGWVVHGSTT